MLFPYNAESDVAKSSGRAYQAGTSAGYRASARRRPIRLASVTCITTPQIVLRRTHSLIRGEYLHTGADLGPVTDGHRDHIQDHAIEIEEHALAQADIEAVIAMERRPNIHVFANRGQALDKQLPTFIDRKRNSSVVAGQPFHRRRHVRLQFGIGGVVQLTRQHLLFFRTRHSHPRH